MDYIQIYLHGEKAYVRIYLQKKYIQEYVYIIYIYVDANLHKNTCMYKYEKLC